MGSATIIVFSILIVFTHQQINSCYRFGEILYKELQCKPVMDQEGSCPKAYECPDYQLSKEYCNFKGKKIEFGDYLERSNCPLRCRCSSKPWQQLDEITHAEINCAVVDCPKDLGTRHASNCYETQSLKECCNTGKKCLEEGETVPTCTVDGETYNETQIFSPDFTCMFCQCTKDFVEGKYEESDNCQKKYCDSEIKYTEKIAKNCAPVYSSGEGKWDFCCPYKFICADEDEDIIIPSTNTENADLKCKFGDKILNYKDSFTRKNKEWRQSGQFKCSCDLPPLVTCTIE